MSSAMDLVAEYNSDAEIEEVKSSSIKEVDFIDIADSDAEDCPPSDIKLDIKSEIASDKETDSPTVSNETDSPTVSKETDSPTVSKETDSPTVSKKTDSPTVSKENDSPTVSKETDCELETSDKGPDCSLKGKTEDTHTGHDELDETAKHTSGLVSSEDAAIADNTCTNSSETSAQITDYLNLNGSDSEIEEAETPSKVEQLLLSASELSNAACGPTKPSEEGEVCTQQADSLTAAEIKEKTNVVDSSEDTNVVDSLSEDSRSSGDSSSEGTSSSADIKPDLEKLKQELECNITENVYEYDSVSESSRKRLKYNDDSDTDVGEDLPQAETYIYRRDGRVSHSYRKHLLCCIPTRMKKTYIGHANVVTTMDWCIPSYSHLLLSASADCTLKIWDMYCNKPVRQFEDSSGLKVAKWSLDGEQVIFGGYGKKAHVFDVLSGRKIYSYDVYNYLTSMKVHPYYRDVFLCGTRNAILAFDLRVNSTLPIRTFFSKCEEVLDIQFMCEDEFVCSTNVVTRDSADRTIMAWDFPSGALLSNQIYLERYTCPSLRIHPYDMTFLAQSNGDYIASFSTNRPYRRRSRRFVGHKVSGFGIDCEVSPDGKYVASGDANGDIYFYNYVSTEILQVIPAKPNVPVNRVRWHPFFSSIVAVATWDGHMQIWK